MTADNRAAKQAMMDDRLRQDFRRHRADRLASTVMHILGGTIEGREREAYHRLFDAFYEQGFEIVTEEERRASGEEPRDEKGWTATERLEYRQKLADAFLRPLTPIFLDKPKGS